MAIWTTPIYDRTANDVADAKRILLQIANLGYDSITDEDKAKWTAGFRGALTFQTMNRIEGNIEYLYSIWHDELGYYTPIYDIKTDWNNTDIPDRDVDAKIVHNTKSFVDGSWAVEGVNIPSSIAFPQIDDINAIEEIHQIMYNRIDKVKKSYYPFCGTTYCG